MTTPLPDDRKVLAVWILRDPGEFYEYRDVPGSFARRGKSLGFDLHCTLGDDEEFEVLLTPSKAGWRMKFETDEGTEEIALKEFRGDDEIVLSHESLGQTVYLRLPAAAI